MFQEAVAFQSLLLELFQKIGSQEKKEASFKTLNRSGISLKTDCLQFLPHDTHWVSVCFS